MLKLSSAKFFVLLALVLSVLATPTSTPTPQVETVQVDYGVERNQDLWGEDTASFLDFSEKLKDWSYCNYSSKERCAMSSLVSWGGKLYDPLSFKGAENDSYGKHCSKIPYLEECL